ncbi:GntR family transcriptional regulator [Aliiroseovarius sp. YM-037]|uniref:GntR family transcriptional regulator n=1 Tax=Aliiroseovarius sp. YM-037 TaxID=3341728 RepID=UPI003A801444
MAVTLDPLVDETRRGQIVRQLRGLIVSGAVPAGQRLTEQGLADQLGVSRAPLREAIGELVDCGLLVSQPYRGITVRNFTRRDLEELYSMRTALEKFAFRTCWDKRTPEALNDLRNRNEAVQSHPLDGDSPLHGIELELELHSWCYELSDHTLLQQAWRRIVPNLQFYFALNERAHQPAGMPQNPHDTYVELACGDDLNEMLAHLDTHLRQGLARTLSYIDTASDATSEEYAQDGKVAKL